MGTPKTGLLILGNPHLKIRAQAGVVFAVFLKDSRFRFSRPGLRGLGV